MNLYMLLFPPEMHWRSASHASPYLKKQMNCNGLTKLQLTLSPATFYNEQGKAHESKACNEGGKNQNHEKRIV